HACLLAQRQYHRRFKQFRITKGRILPVTSCAREADLSDTLRQMFAYDVDHGVHYGQSPNGTLSGRGYEKSGLQMLKWSFPLSGSWRQSCTYFRLTTTCSFWPNRM